MSTSVLALVTAFHVALLLARRRRSRLSAWRSLALLPPAIFSIAPWIVPDRALIGSGVALHLIWFAACERWLPARAQIPRQAAAATSVAPRSAAAQPRASTAPLRSRAPADVPVLATFDETPDIRTFRLQRPPGFDFTPGQFLTVRLEVNGKPMQRAYSISSSPHAHGYLEISVKRIGVVSGAMHASVRAGSHLTVRPPAGTFTYPTNDDRPLTLIAGGIGITPLVSMLRHACAAEPTRPVTLFYSIKTEEDFAFRDELWLLTRRHPQIRIAVTVTKGPASDGCHAGRLTPALVRAYVPDPTTSLVFICGPADMIEAVKGLMRELDVPDAQVHSESFRAAMKMVTEEAAAGAAAPVAAPGAASTTCVRFAKSGCEARVRPAETLLEAAEAQGVDVPFVCREGICHTCMTRLLEGDVDCRADSLSASEREAGYILPCVSHARGDCVLEA